MLTIKPIYTIEGYDFNFVSNFNGTTNKLSKMNTFLEHVGINKVNIVHFRKKKQNKEIFLMTLVAKTGFYFIKFYGYVDKYKKVRVVNVFPKDANYFMYIKSINLNIQKIIPSYYIPIGKVVLSLEDGLNFMPKISIDIVKTMDYQILYNDLYPCIEKDSKESQKKNLELI